MGLVVVLEAPTSQQGSSWTLVSLGQGRWNCDHGSMQLLERASALDALGGWLADARAGRGRLVLVGGEAGVGKTSLLDEFAARQRPAAGSSGAPATR